MNKLYNIVERNVQKIIIISTILLFVVGLFTLYYVFEVRSTSNDECIWAPQKNGDIVFQTVKVDGVTWNAGIRNGDKLISIQGVRIYDVQVAQGLINQLYTGQYANYTYEHNGKLIETKVYIKKLIQFNSVGFTLLSIIWLVVGFIVVLAKVDGKVQKLFYLIGAAFTIFMAIVFYMPPVKATPPLIYLLIVSTISGIFAPFFIIHFFWLFPRRSNILNKKWVEPTLYIVPTVLFFGGIIFSIIYYADRKFELINYVRTFNFINILFVIGFCVGFISLARSFYKLKNKADRKPLLLILLAYALGITGMLYTFYVAPAITDSIFNSPEFYMPIVLVVLLPISFGISIFKYQLLDVSIIIKNTVTYAVATVTLAAIYFLIIYVLGQSISSAIGTPYQGVIAGIIFIIFALIFQSTKNKFQDFITEKFYPEQFAYQKVLLSFSNDVTTFVGLNNILDKMTSTYTKGLMVKNFGIMLRSANDEYTLARAIGLKDNEFLLKDGIVDDIIAEKISFNKPAAISRDDFYRTFKSGADKLIDDDIYTIIPMTVKSKTIGLLLFGLKHSGAQFAGKDLELLIAGANQAAVSIENTRLYRSEVEKLQIEKDLELARKIQSGLLPKCVPALYNLDICGIMVPAMQVGGDYFDYIQVSDKKLFIVVGDVSGKGLSASLYMTKLQTMMQIACTDDKTPREILVDINKKLYETMERNWFITLTLALFDLENQKVKFCRAGHMPILAALNGKVKAHKTQGIGLGLEKGKIFESSLVEEEINLTQGQIFAFFSDGIVEAMNKDGGMFGEEKLEELLKDKKEETSTQVMDDIWNSILDFRKDAEQNDDMTMVLVKVK